MRPREEWPMEVIALPLCSVVLRTPSTAACCESRKQLRTINDGKKRREISTGNRSTRVVVWKRVEDSQVTRRGMERERVTSIVRTKSDRCDNNHDVALIVFANMLENLFRLPTMFVVQTPKSPCKCDIDRKASMNEPSKLKKARVTFKVERDVWERNWS